MYSDVDAKVEIQSHSRHIHRRTDTCVTYNTYTNLFVVSDPHSVSQAHTASCQFQGPCKYFQERTLAYTVWSHNSDAITLSETVRVWRRKGRGYMRRRRGERRRKI
jgi:hypothetical protein